MQENIVEKLKQIITAQLNLPMGTIDINTKFHADLGLDSIDVVSLINAINIEFNIKLIEQEVIDIDTVQQMVCCIEQHIVNDN